MGLASSSYYTKQLGKADRDMTRLVSMRDKLNAIIKTDATIDKQLNTLATDIKAALVVGCSSALQTELRSQNYDAHSGNVSLLNAVNDAISELKRNQSDLRGYKADAEAAERAARDR